MVRAMPARDRAMASAANSTTRRMKQPTAARVDVVSNCFAPKGRSSRGSSFDRPSRRQKNKDIDEGCKMISVCKEADGFGRIGELEKAKRACGALGNLQKPKEGTDHPDSEDHEAQPPTIAIAKQKHSDKKRKRRKE